MLSEKDFMNSSLVNTVKQIIKQMLKGEDEPDDLVSTRSRVDSLQMKKVGTQERNIKKLEAKKQQEKIEIAFEKGRALAQ